jgi:putative PEP-CTERM system histidine kinase
MRLLNALSYGAAALGFFVLTMLLLAAWRGRASGTRLILATAGSSIWATVFAYHGGWGGVPAPLLVAIELMRTGLWLFVLEGLIASAPVGRYLARSAILVASAGAAFGLALLALHRSTFAGLDPLTLLVWGGIALPVVGLVVLEQIYRNADGTGQRALRPLVLGLGGILVFDLFMYSESSLVHAISAEAWGARGFIDALCLPMLAIAANRNPSWSLEVFVSRQVVFYTTTFTAVGLYLLGVSAGGYLLALLGGAYGEFFELLFFAGAILLLLVLAGSGALRARLRVFLSKHFYRNKYDYRVEWLRFVLALESAAEGRDRRQSMVRAVAQILGSHAGTLWIRDDDGKRLVAVAQWSEHADARPPFAALEADSDFIRYVADRQWVVELPEYRRNPAAYGNFALPDSLAAPHDLVLFVPLMHGGELVGLLGLTAPDAPFSMSYEDRDLLKTVGRHIGMNIAQLETDRRLAEARQFEAYNRLTAFLMHDLKNLVAQLSLVVANAERHKHNPEFVDDAIDTIRHSTDRITRLIEQLHRGELRSVERRVLVRAVLERALERLAGRRPTATLESTADDAIVRADPERLAMSIEHLVRNAQDATPQDGAVSVRLSCDGGRVRVQVADTGSGMTPEFVRTRLFRPFDSTKGAKGMGIGAYQVREYVRDAGGDVAVSSSAGAGTVFSIALPLARADEDDRP